MTIETLRAFGHVVDGEGPWTVRRGEATPDRYETPGDFSSAVPLLASAGVCGGEVALTGLAWPCADADARAVPILEGMGIDIGRNAGVLVARAARGNVRPVSVHAGECPDSVPALAALAAFASGESRFEDIGHLRFKESDRLAALVDLLDRAGTRAVADATGLTVRGGAGAAPSGEGSLPTFRDHRIAMAACLLAIGRPGLRIEDPDCVSKSYPEFFRDLDSLCRR
jgi:3-phosphoshikimate 1-carboxyvinyltransferase